MKRHPAFQDLSRDHFTALNRCLQIIRAVDGHPHALPFDQALASFQALWTHDGLREHFGEEETDLVPVLEANAEGKALAGRMLAEHTQLRGRFDNPDQPSPAEAATTARLLTAHARWEEESVFEWLQRHLSGEQLQELLIKSQSYRLANGLPVNPPRT